MQAKPLFAIKGNIIFAKEPKELTIHANQYLVCRDGQVDGIYEELPEALREIPLMDYGNQIIMPGLTDLHIHAPQFAFRGLGMDLELLEWLEAYPFKEEAKYSNYDYALEAYENFVADLLHGATARVAIFATIHEDSTNLLMQLLDKSGLAAFVGKVNMDRHCPIKLKESTAESLASTERWLIASAQKYAKVKPIITPRFIPSCSAELNTGLGRLARTYQVPVQSHLSENKAEVAWVSQLHPEFSSYSEVYDNFGLFGGPVPTLMAHCVHCTDLELQLMAQKGVYVAHCPQSNTNLASGIAPIRHILDMGISVGLGTDVAGGFSSSIFRAMSDAVQVSKLRHALLDDKDCVLSIPEAFYLGTKGGGSFWGLAGSFEPGYSFDALVIDDQNIMSQDYQNLEQRLERIIYLSDKIIIKSKYVMGKRLF
jgi:guanine deaminase